MKIAVIGGGAIGLLTAFYLKKSGHEVTVVTKTARQKEELQQKGITLHKNNVITNEFVNVCAFSENNYRLQDLWIVALKQYHLDRFFELWQGDANLPPVLFLQNGMGHLEKAEKKLETSIFAGSVTHGAIKKSDTEVIHTGVGDLVIGNWNGDFEHLTMIENMKTPSSSFPIILSDNISYILKRKLLVNLVINPLTALYRVQNGELMKNKFFLQNAKDVFFEGVRALSLNESEWDYVLKVIENTAGNESSMLRDIKEGRKTEIEAITGYVLQVGEEKKLSLPFVRFLHRSIMGLERGE